LRATTTAGGIRRKCEASWALAWRSSGHGGHGTIQTMVEIRIA
jgi:hypothetical protein